MPTRHGRRTVSARLVLAAILALLACAPAATFAPTPTDAVSWRHLPAPRSNYSPRFVWQKRNNCVWASGAMLLDKWSHGSVRRSQYVLRKASGDKKDGSSLRDLARGFARAAGVKLRTPGIDPMHWWQFLDRLASGGGAVLIGEYNRMPAHFSRFSPSYAARKESSHAVYVERYDRRHGRVWIKDPLGPSGWGGEWIPVDDLRRFADVENGIVQAAATPPWRRPKAQPLIDQAYRLGAPQAAETVLAGAGLTVLVPLRITDGFPRPTTQRLIATWRPVDGGGKPIVTRSKAVRPARTRIVARLATPAEPGHYLVDLVFRPAKGKGQTRGVGSIPVRVTTDFAGAVKVKVDSERPTGKRVPVRVDVRNVGSVDWRPALAPDLDVAAVNVPASDTPAQLNLTWRSKIRDEVEAVTLPVALAPGEGTTMELVVPPPPSAGVWWLEGVIGHPVLGRMPDMDDVMSPARVDFVDPGGRGTG